MAKYRITAPDGGTYEIEAPDSASQDEVLAYAQSNFAKQPAAQLSPVDKAMRDFNEKGWGSGAGNAAYDAGAGVTDLAAKFLPSPAAAALGYAANVATSAVPSLLGAGAAQGAVPTMQSGAQRIMQSALKPILSDLRTGKAAKAIQTMLDDGINATSGGAMKLKAKISDLNDEISNAIMNSPATVDKAQVGSYLGDLVRKFRNQVNPGADVAAVKDAWQEFLNHPLMQGITDIPVQVAQKIKQGTYAALGNKSYGEVKTAATEAQKTLARGLKEEIAAAVPQIAPLNAQESALLNAKNIIERRALMEGNRNPGGIGVISPSMENFAAWLASSSPAVKSIAARALYSGASPIAAAGGAVPGILYGYMNNNQ